MLGNPDVIARLNELLADELTAINQYMVHAEMVGNWGYDRLHEKVEERAIEEMKHAEKLIARIIFLEGQPTVSQLNAVHIGPDVKSQIESDKAAEVEAIDRYNDSIRLTVEQSDNGTREMLEDILEDEEEHLDWLEAQLDLIGQIGLPGYLQTQVH